MPTEEDDCHVELAEPEESSPGLSAEEKRRILRKSMKGKELFRKIKARRPDAHSKFV